MHRISGDFLLRRFEEDKPAAEQGTYLHPVEYGQAESLGLDYQRNQALDRPEPPPQPPVPPEENP